MQVYKDSPATLLVITHRLGTIWWPICTFACVFHKTYLCFYVGFPWGLAEKIKHQTFRPLFTSRAKMEREVHNFMRILLLFLRYWILKTKPKQHTWNRCFLNAAQIKEVRELQRNYDKKTRQKYTYIANNNPLKYPGISAYPRNGPTRDADTKGYKFTIFTNSNICLSFPRVTYEREEWGKG